MRYLRISLAVLVMLASLQLFAQKMILRPAEASTAPKRHPYTAMLKAAPSPKDQQVDSRSANYERLLVILVDFQEEIPDNPLTTGNGKFELEASPDYLYSIGKPPHDNAYFQANLEAARFYYLAVSSGSFNLDYEIYPQDKQAYTLPHELSYYNPPGANSDTFISRIEEYFKDAFEAADQDSPEINFSSYDHYMIIHAGSDWQHDVFGDSPSDLPSFFIRVNDEDKAVSVDNDTHKIYHACNVPATISQDFRSQSSGTDTFRSGYGALNSVLVHELGHSLGLVDLYNVRTFQPMVGSFDIMDSGGSGSLVDGPLDDGSFVVIEGILPALPGAFSRSLLFEEEFRYRGLMKDADELPIGQQINLAASSMKVDTAGQEPTIIKIPISQNRYVLLENRSVDPDGDGATAVFSTLDGRVILYPTPIDDITNTPSYEYDYLLPSFLTSNGNSVGGGILAWLIDEDIIYNQGQTYSDGEWVSNFENNTVNIAYSKRGVQVIEADALPDIGNEYSWYWTGTPYEYFHRYKPTLYQDGSFFSWSTEPWTPQLGPQTNPPLADTQGISPIYRLQEIGNPSALMSFKLSNAFFDNQQVISRDSTSTFAAPLITTSLSISEELPILSHGSISFYSQIGADGNWQKSLGTFPITTPVSENPPILMWMQGNEHPSLVLSAENRISIVDFENDSYHERPVDFPANISTPPINVGFSLIIANPDCLFRMTNNEVENYCHDVSGVSKLAASSNKIWALSESTLYSLSPELVMIEQIELHEAFGDYEPVVFEDIETGQELLFLVSNAGSIYLYNGSLVERIYHNTLLSLPSNLALVDLEDYSPALVFGLGSKIYAIRHDGSYIPGFPLTSTGNEIQPYSHPKALRLDDLEILYLPTHTGGYLAVDSDGHIQPSYSLFWNKLDRTDYWQYQPDRSELIWYYPQSGGKLVVNTLHAMEESPIMWNGFRNGNSGRLQARFKEPPATSPSFDAYIYPNPVKGDNFRLRLQDHREPGYYAVYDISGTLIGKENILPNGNNLRDLYIETVNLSSGIYILQVKSGNSIKTLKFAIEK